MGVGVGWGVALCGEFSKLKQNSHFYNTCLVQPSTGSNKLSTPIFKKILSEKPISQIKN